MFIEIDGHTLDREKVIAVTKVYTTKIREHFTTLSELDYVEVYFDIHLQSCNSLRVHRTFEFKGKPENLDKDKVLQTMLKEVNKARTELVGGL